MLLASVVDIYSFFDSLGRKYEAKEVTGFFKNSTSKDLKDFIGRGYPLYYCKQEQGQGVYCPPGFLFWELVGPESDFAGAKAVVFLQSKHDSTGESVTKSAEELLSDVCKVLMAHGTNNPVAVAARDVLSSLGEQ